MCKLIIKQPEYQRIELEFEDVVEASVTVNHLKPHAKNTTFTIVCETLNEEGEQEEC